MNKPTTQVRIIRASRVPTSVSPPLAEISSASHRVLHTGCGASTPRSLHPAYRSTDWEEVRLDINPAVAPDLVGSVVDMRGFVQDASMDSVWCSHSIEHLYEHEVPKALSEFRRVLKSDGFALITCPDLEEVVKIAAQHGPNHVVYRAPVGPIRAIDMLFGYARAIGEGNHYMAHHTGFTLETLGTVMAAAGFAEVRVGKGPNWDLWAAGLMPDTDLERLRTTFAGTEQKFIFDDQSVDQAEFSTQNNRAAV